MNSALAPIDRLRVLPREERLAFYRSLPPGALAAAATAPRVWARPVQILPRNLARIELLTGGFGAGKTQAAMWRFLEEWASGRARRCRLVSSTKAQVRDTLLHPEAPSGLWRWLPYELKARVGHDFERAYIPSTGHAGTFEIPGLPPILCAAYEKPGSFQGAGVNLTLADDPAAAVEVCGERKVREALDKIRTSTREGRSPCVLLPTTTGGMGMLRRMLSGDMRGVHRTHLRSAAENTALSRAYVDDVLADFIGQGDDGDWTGIETTHRPGALWRPEWISAHRVQIAPELVRVVVALDPADTGADSADSVGIVVVGLGVDARLYVLADYTAQWEAPQWAAIAAWAFTHYKADAIVCELNRSESAVRACLAVAGPGVPVVGVDATRDKATRAGPCAMLHQAGDVSWVSEGPQLCRPGHVWIRVPIFDPRTGRREEVELEIKRDRRGWQTLEDELCGWVPGETRRSPGGLDALVWACWHLRPPDGPAYAEGSRFAGIGAVALGRHEDDPRSLAIGVGFIASDLADPRWER
jgi:phage terminase large subunit-like protein